MKKISGKKKGGKKRHSLSIRARITLWFTGALVIVIIFTFLVVIFAGNQILQKTIRDSLIETVENNVDEIEYYSSAEEMEFNETDSYLSYVDGYLEIDDDFLDAVNEVYTAIYNESGEFIYGENPISSDTDSLEFKDLQVQTMKVDGTKYYIFDRSLEGEGLEGLWLRGVVSESQGNTQLEDITKISAFVLPLLAAIACIGGYMIAGRMLRPVKKISDTAKEIGRNNDLKKRIDIEEGTDELHELADTFNEMFDRLDRTFESQKRFTSDASHELRTPVSVISSQCELSLEKRRSPEEYEQALSVIQRQSRKMSKLINDMLNFTRLEVNPERYVKENIDLSVLVLSICEDMALIRDKNITLSCSIEPGIIFKGNRELLLTMVSNLISNGYRYGRPDGYIKVYLIKEEDEIRLSVEDNGVGIASEDKEKIFERFYRADPSRSTEGMGLGLSMAMETARFHGGSITVESETGIGSTFIITLPA